MNCNQIQELLPAYQDGELGFDDRDEVKEHLRTCVSCREEGGALSDSWAMLGQLEEVKLSPTFEARFWRRVREEEARSWRWMPSWKVLWAPLAAVWMLGLVSGVSLFSTRLTHRNTATGLALSTFTSPVPPNSIEYAYLSGTGR